MKLWTIIILTLLGVSTKAQQPWDSLVDGRLLEKEMQLWLAVNDSERVTLLFEKAALYKDFAMYEEALTELERVAKLNTAFDGKKEYHYRRMLYAFLAGRYNVVCDVIIDSLDLHRMHLEREYNFMRLYALNATEKWKHCKRELLQHCEATDTALIQKIQSLSEFPKYYDPGKYKTLSAIFPGLGQTVLGYPLKGFTSLAIQSTLLAVAGYSYYTGFYAFGTVTGVFPWMKFYGGGKRLSANLAEDKNNQARIALQEEYTRTIKSVIK